MGRNAHHCQMLEQWGLRKRWVSAAMKFRETGGVREKQTCQQVL